MNEKRWMVGTPWEFVDTSDINRFDLRGFVDQIRADKSYDDGTERFVAEIEDVTVLDAARRTFETVQEYAYYAVNAEGTHPHDFIRALFDGGFDSGELVTVTKAFLYQNLGPDLGEIAFNLVSVACRLERAHMPLGGD